MRKVFAQLAGKLRRMTAGLREKPDVQIDDYVLEHFLLYNGLVGSTPENQPQYRDVRNDVVQAVNDRSAHQLAIALKLSPLWWEDRLEKIFTELASVNRESTIDCLLANRPIDDITGDTTPLSHTNWQVRSNAARMLAFLQEKKAIPRLVELLDDCENERRAAFCHIAYSLAKLGSEQSRLALIPFIEHSEPWFGVDAAGALSHFNLASVAPDLMTGILTGNELDDYMAVAIARRHKPLEFAEYKDEEIQEGSAELVMSLLKGLNGAFHSEHHLKQQLQEIAPRLNEMATTNPTARRLHAAISLNKWMADNALTASRSQEQIRDLSNKKYHELVKETLATANYSSAPQLGDLKHALRLTAQFKLTEMSPYLLPLIKEDFPALADLMDCLSVLGDTAAAPKIAELIGKKVNLDERCRSTPQAHPVFETDKQSADIYWSALKALGSFPHKSSVEVLSKAVNDFAPDKREQALLSLQTVLLSEDLHKNHYSGNLQDLIRERTDDPSSLVQAAALGGVAQHRLSGLIPDVLKCLNSRETSVQRRASETLFSLANNGHKDAVKQSLEAGISKELDSGKKQRMNKVLQRIQ